MKEHIVVLCDYGLDDAAATCDLLCHADGFGKIDILAVGGNFPADVSFRNLKTLAASVPHDDRLTLVDTTAVAQPGETLYNIHGSDGMGGVLAPCSDGTRVQTFAEWFGEYRGCDVLLSLGPMTVTEILLEKAQPKRFIFMAGCVDAKPNFHGYEFNEGLDPAAFSRCVTRPHKAVTLDVAVPALDVSEKEITTDDLYHTLVGRYRELSRERGEKPCVVWDDIAVKYLLHPELFREQTKTDKNGNTLCCLEYIGGEYSEI